MPLHLETSGVDPLSGQFDWITLSPKRHRPPSEPMLAACHELKVVVEGEADLAFAEAMAGRALALRRQAGGPPALLLQPAWEHPDAQPLAIAYVRSHPAWRLSLQSHKWLGVR
jgi:organic radical activating enzyme